ncbi:MAG: gamma-glutamyl-gamma-aminobutyrate hydrolase family protein [Solirubrobacterales bacterium]
MGSEQADKRGDGAAPLIGIGGIPMQCQFGGVWDEPVTMIHRAYTQAIARGGGAAVLFTPDTVLRAGAARLLEAVDALILPGGGDIDPGVYGAEREEATVRVDRERDEAELALCRAALDADLPVLGICRGMELLNVALGGTLHQHLPARIGHDGHLRDPGSFERHEVELEPGSAAARLVGAPRCAVMSHHHQAVDALGEGVAASGWERADGVVEAIELPAARLAVGVQWHPEEDPSSELIPNFVATVAAARRPA